MKKIMALVSLMVIALAVFSSAQKCPYNNDNRETHGILIRGNATHEAVNGVLVPKEDVVRDDGLFWKCEIIWRDNTEVKDCRLYERIEFEWHNDTDCSAWCNETNTTEEVIEPEISYEHQFILSMLAKLFLGV